MIVLVFLLIATAFSVLLPESNAFQTSNNKRKILQGTSSSVQLNVSFSSEWYAVSAFPVAVPPPPVAVFEQQQQQRQTKKNRRRNKVRLLPGHQPLQTEITTSEEMDTFLNNDDDRLVIIKFYASWCKSCAKVGMKMDRLALEHADHVDDLREKNNDVNIISRKGNVRIANVEFATNRELCQRMGITRLPTIQMYITSDDGNNNEQGRRRMMKKVQDFPCPPSKFHQVEDLANFYMNKQQRVQNQQQILFESTLDLGHDLIENVLEQEQAFQIATAAAPFSSPSPTSVAEQQQQQSSFQQQPRRRRRFWSRLRRNNNNKP